MFLAKNKIIIYFFTITLVSSFLLGCFLIAQNIFEDTHSGMNSTECCQSNIANSADHGINGVQYIVAGNSILQLILYIVLAFVVFSVIKDNRFVNYYYLIRDKYGGFKLFYKFTLLFKTGLLHPKIF